MNFSCTLHDTIPPDLSLSRCNLNGTTTLQTVKTVATYKYLGIVFNSKLHWTAHLQKIIASATWWSNQVVCLSKISGGMPTHHVQQLYNTVTVPTFTYAADIWYTSTHLSSTGKKYLSSIVITKKLIPVQHQAAKLITGALNTTAGNVLDAHANLLSVDLLFDKVLFRATAHLASLLPTHPLHLSVCKAAKHYVKKHRSLLHNLFSTTIFNPTSVKKIALTHW